MTPFRVLAFAALVLTLVVSGCGGSGLVEVSGRLMHDGKPVPSTRVVFQPDDGSRRSTGVTNDDGYFTLQYAREQSGAKPGPCTVFVKYDMSIDEELHKIQPKASKELRKVIDKYGDPKTSKLHYDITHSGQFVEVVLP
jgi:hypothetical protein